MLPKENINKKLYIVNAINHVLSENSDIYYFDVFRRKEALISVWDRRKQDAFR